MYRRASLLDLNGINTRYQARLNAHGIFTPLDFYAATLPLLKQQVFRSINGYYWYLRLRGYEIDAIDFARKSFGNTYALQQQTNDHRDLAKLLMKLCEKTGRRLRRANYSAQGVHVAMVYTDLSWWHTGRKFDVPVYTTQEIYEKALRLLNMSGYKRKVRNLAVSVYDLVPTTDEQLALFASPMHAVSEAMDKINDRWGRLLNPPLSGYRIDIARKNPSARQKKKDTAPQANIPHDFGTPIKRGKASGLLNSNGCCCYDTHIACVS